LERDVPTMNLDYVLKPAELDVQAGVREAIAFAIHLEKKSLDFYQKMAKGCTGAPMADVFARSATMNRDTCNAWKTCTNSIS